MLRICVASHPRKTCHFPGTVHIFIRCPLQRHSNQCLCILTVVTSNVVVVTFNIPVVAITTTHICHPAFRGDNKSAEQIIPGQLRPLRQRCCHPLTSTREMSYIKWMIRCRLGKTVSSVFC